jgi:hypothetical protein
MAKITRSRSRNRNPRRHNASKNRASTCGRSGARKIREKTRNQISTSTRDKEIDQGDQALDA